MDYTAYRPASQSEHREMTVYFFYIYAHIGYDGLTRVLEAVALPLRKKPSRVATAGPTGGPSGGRVSSTGRIKREITAQEA